MKKTRTIDSPVGLIRLESDGEALTGLYFGGERCNDGCTVLDRAQRQLEEYFSGRRREFDIPMDMGGTDFQRKCWQALTEIPYGETRSYSDIALQVGSPKGVRAVGMANHVNPIPIIVPCHRVVGKNGSLTGYAGGLDMKTWLIEHEKRHI